MFNDKARLWCRGRRRIFSRMAEAVAGRSGADGCPDTLSVCGAEAKERTRTGDGSDHCTAGTDLIWFHCASLGEFEQGRPVIEAFRAAHPGWKILLTFFSPSGYEVRKNYAGADYIFYLPGRYAAQCPAVRFDFPSEDRRIRQIRVLGQLPVRIAAQRCAGLPDLRDFPARAVVF